MAESKKGGKIAPDGRPAQAKGVGKNARRHDLEKPKGTPGLRGDLQYGEAQELEQGQRSIEKTTQGPARPQTATQASQPVSAPSGSGPLQTPDPRSFMAERLQGTLQGSPTLPPEGAQVRAEPWLPLIQAMATAPNAGGVLGAAYVGQLSAALGRPQGRVRALDMNELDKKVGEILG